LWKPLGEKDEGGRMKDENGADRAAASASFFILHPSAFILVLTE
jgi:hypothetical protein